MNEKSLYVRRMESKVEEFGAELNILRGRLRSMSEEEREPFEEEIRKLKSRRETTKAKLLQVKNANDASWKSVRTQSDRAIKDMAMAIRRLKSRFHY